MKKLVRNVFALMAFASVTFVSCDSSDDNTTGGDEQFEVNPSDFKGTIDNGTVTLSADVEYRLTGKLVVEDGAKLIIPAGTKIVGTGGTSAYIAVAQGGKIEVNGTKNNPVVMTGVEETPGNWGGLVICGKAPINKAESATSEVAELTYGGTVANDNSGVIRYLRIEYAGANFSTEKEFNGLSMFGVGSGTTIEYVQAYNGSDDGFEFFGGTVSAKYLVSTGNEDDQFDWTEGWVGQDNQFWYAKENSAIGNRGIEADNNSSNHMATPISSPKIKNITLIGRGDTGNEPDALKLRVGTHANIDNLVISNFGTGFNIEHDATIAAVASGDLKVTNVKFMNVTTMAKGKDNNGDSADVSGVYTENNAATGAGNGVEVPSWAQGWTR